MSSAAPPARLDSSTVLTNGGTGAANTCTRLVQSLFGRGARECFSPRSPAIPARKRSSLFALGGFMLSVQHPLDCGCSVCWSFSVSVASSVHASYSCSSCSMPRLVNHYGVFYVSGPAIYCTEHAPSDASKPPSYNMGAICTDSMH